jgi:hypothetical protein
MQGDLREAYAPRRAAGQQKAAKAAEPLLAAALAGQAVGEVAASKQAAATTDRNPPSRPDEPERSGDVAMEEELSPATPDDDPGAATIHQEISAEDTIHRVPKAPESQSPGK